MLFGLLFGGRPKPLDGATAKEALATLREAALIPFDLATTPPPPAHADGGPRDLVVMLHGFFASPGVFRPMRELFATRGIASATFSHLPGTKVAPLAQQLSALVARIPFDIRVHLLGHSLGGLVARWYVQELQGDARVTQTISLGAPFGGTTVARHFPIGVGRDLHHDAPLLRRLCARATDVVTPHTSFVGSRDAVVVPIEGALLPGHPVEICHNLGHNSLLFDSAVLDKLGALILKDPCPAVSTPSSSPVVVARVRR